jgi:hypothetical protein
MEHGGLPSERTDRSGANFSCKRLPRNWREAQETQLNGVHFAADMPPERRRI